MNAEKKIVNRLFEDLLEGREKLPWYFKLWHWYIKAYVRDIKYYFKKRYQTLTTGFPYEQVWNFKNWHSEVVTPRLKHLRNNLHGYPSTLESVEEWQEILDKMIWSFEHHDDFVEPIYSDDYDHRYEVTKVDGGCSYKSMNETGTIDWTPVQEHNNKVQEGLELFAKYYVSLWD